LASGSGKLQRPLRLGVCLGDPTGIGSEITLKALWAELPCDDTRYVLMGDSGDLRARAQRLGLPLKLPEVSTLATEVGGRTRVYNPSGRTLGSRLQAGCREGAEAALDWLTVGARCCLLGELDGLVTAPLSKEAVLRTGRPFTGQTEYLTELAGGPRTGMMLLGQDEKGRWLRVMLVTTHVPICRLAAAITPERVEQAARLAAQACAQLGLATCRIAVCGLNPHAGEGGLMGDEEVHVITPALERLRSEGLDLRGPLSGDTVFHAALCGEYDVVVAMYHDQGLAPLKLVAFDTGVNWTVGLPFVRTSPDHGPAYDIAGRGIANPSSMRAALRLARQLAQPARGPS
jgi:4-hydroxythreonine-4-phosphate dehydrogenase